MATAMREQVTPVYAIPEVSEADMAARIRATQQAHGQTIQEFHTAWYQAAHTWTYTKFLGVQLMKNPLDLWIYQMILTDLRPKTIIETGTYTGASALWYAVLMDLLDIDEGRVFTVDIDDYRACQHPRITFLDGSSTDHDLVAALVPEIQYPLLVSLDSDHGCAHVRAELDLYAPLCRPGDWLVVEDTNVCWPGKDRGPSGAIVDYMTEHPGEWWQDAHAERYLLTCNPGGWLRRV